MHSTVISGWILMLWGSHNIIHMLNIQRVTVTQSYSQKSHKKTILIYYLKQKKKVC